MTAHEITRIDPSLPRNEALDFSKSGKAFLVTAGKSGFDLWVPLSIATFCDAGTHTSVMVPEWFMRDKGLLH